MIVNGKNDDTRGIASVLQCLNRTLISTSDGRRRSVYMTVLIVLYRVVICSWRFSKFVQSKLMAICLNA